MDEEFREFLEIFREESLERLAQASRALEALGAGGSEPDARWEEVERELHTLKGSARLLGLERLGKLVHDAESLGRLSREGGGRHLDLLVEVADRLAGLVEAAAASGEDPGDDDLEARVAAALAGDDPGPGGAPAAGPGPPLPDAPDAPLAPPAPPAPPAAPSDPAAPGTPPPAGPTPPPAGPTPRGTARRAGRERSSDQGAPLETGRQRPPGDDELVRVRASRLASLDGVVSELALTHQRLGSHEDDLQRLLLGVEEGSAGGDDVVATLRQVLHAYRVDALQVQRSTRQLQQLAVDVRLRPVEVLFDQVPREARSIARQVGKQVAVQLHGVETEVDRVILEGLKGPLLHLVRNAVDHGVESPEDRAAGGKPPKGRLDVSAGQEGGQIVIRVEDDGGGVDPARIRELAVARRVLDAGSAAALGDDEAIQLIFVPGFSTRGSASEISGRGIGMDVVKTTVEHLGGDVRVESEPGRGTRTTIRVPTSLLVARVTFVRSGGQQFGLPTESLVESLRLPQGKLTTFSGRDAVVLEGRSVPAIRLAALLGHRVLPDPARLNVLVVGHAEERLALVIEELLEERSVVVKPLGWPLDLVKGLSGAVQLPSGEMALLLHVPDLFALQRGGRLEPRLPAAPSRRSVLVVDDSIVSRQLVARHVESLGLDVITAVDGLDALGILERVEPSLVITDVEMPRLGGLGLVRRIRGDERLAQTPVMIVSTRGSEADRQAGLEAGADAYLAKSELSQKAVKQAVERLL